MQQGLFRVSGMVIIITVPSGGQWRLSSKVGGSLLISRGGSFLASAEGHSTTLTGSPEDENSIANPTKIVPSAGRFAAAGSFNYRFPAHSITILRIAFSK
jgi:hypothetical protein